MHRSSADVEHLLAVGMTPTTAAEKAEAFSLCNAALGAARADRHRWSVWVPGRIELFGKHTDYAGGRSLLCAVERGFSVRVALRRDHRIRAIDVRSGEMCETALSVEPDAVTGWTHYVATVGRRLARNFPSADRGVDLAFYSDLPPAAGMSSSSALMIAVFVALAKSNELRSSEEFRREIFSREELAAYLGCIENGETFRSLQGDAGVGTFGGSQDHTAIMCSAADRIIQYSFAPVRREAVYRMPATHAFVIASCGVAAEKTAGARDAYNRMAALVHELVRQWNAATGRKDATLADAVRSDVSAPDHLREIAAAARGSEYPPDALSRRLEHFLLEAFDIVPAVAAALSHEDMEDLGLLSDRSQRAASDLLGNQIGETVALARSARALGATAASAFGAGFGGSVWAMVPTADAESFADAWRDWYEREFPQHAAAASFFSSAAGPGAIQW